MCGIFGEIRRIQTSNNKFNFKETLKLANKCSHRGPDNTTDYFSTYNSYHLYFVFHRLAINGLDEKSDQPMRINDVVLLCNGEIYNYKRLAVVKTSYHEKIRTILHLYKHKGSMYSFIR